MILLTRREADFERKKNKLVALVERLAIRSVYGPALAALYESRGDRINGDLKRIFGGDIGITMDYIARPATELESAPLHTRDRPPQDRGR